MINLNPNHLSIVEGILAEHVPECEVRVFGSRATWNAKDYSDIDVAIVGDGPLDWRTLGRLKESFEESNLPMRVDVLDWHAISESFRKVIKRDYVVLQERLKRTGTGEWREVTLGELGIVERGRSRHRPRNAPELYGGPYPFIQTGDIKASQGRVTIHKQTYSEVGLAQSRLWPVGTMVITIAANIAETAILTYPACFPDSVIGFVADDSKCDVRFIEYTFRLLRNKLQHENVGTGSVQDNINLQTLDRLRFLIPPPSEQRAIAHVLGTLDDKIELNRRMNETLEAMAQALFKSWFVDFEPVRAKMEGRWRRGESLPGLPAELYDLFPDQLAPSELGEIPEGWGVRRLGDLSQKPQYGYTESAKDEPIGPKFLRITDINKKAWIEWESVPHCDINEKDLKKYRLHKGDILIARMADPGHGCMIEEEKDAVFASYLIRFRPTKENYARFVQYWLRSDKYWEFVRGRGSGTTRVSINAKVLSGFPLVVPTDSILDQFDDTVSFLRDRVMTNTYESHAIAAQRDVLLPRLVSGDVEIASVRMISK